jgi:hypothetical protein
VIIGARRPHRTRGLTFKAFSGLGRALPVTTLSAVAIVLEFAVIAAVTTRFGPDCRSPQRSILIGHTFLAAGCPPHTSRHGDKR